MIRFAIALTVVFTGCTADDEQVAVCANEEAAPDRVPTNVPPDWERVINLTNDTNGRSVSDGSNAEPFDGYREHIQAWDCLDLSWWNPSSPRKVVQVWADETECHLFERSIIELYDCDSHDGIDDLYRDQDGDGVYPSEGDCNDADDAVFPDSSEVCDEKDNNCDGRADEDLDCEDIEALDGGM